MFVFVLMMSVFFSSRINFYGLISDEYFEQLFESDLCLMKLPRDYIRTNTLYGILYYLTLFAPKIDWLIAMTYRDISRRYFKWFRWSTYREIFVQIYARWLASSPIHDWFPWKIFGSPISGLWRNWWLGWSNSMNPSFLLPPSLCHTHKFI